MHESGKAFEREEGASHEFSRRQKKSRPDDSADFSRMPVCPRIAEAGKSPAPQRITQAKGACATPMIK